MNRKLTIVLLLLTVVALAGVPQASATPGQTNACNGCHTLSPSISVTTNVTSITVSPGQSFAVGISWSGGLADTAGTTEVNWPTTFSNIGITRDNSNFTPTPRIPAPSPAGASGTTSSVLTAPTTPGSYIVRVYTSAGNSSAGADGTNFKDINVTVTAPSINGTIAGTVTNASSGLAISGATVKANGMTATTNATGNYSISIAAGTYTVTASANGYQSKTTMPGVVVTSGNVTTQNFALTPLVTPPEQTFNISGFKINDTNGNGVWNPGEMGIPNWKIMLLNDTGVQLANTSTNAQGFYQFMNIFPDRYNVAEEMKPGFTSTNATTKAVIVENMDITNVNFTNQVNVTPPPQKGTFNISGFKINGSSGAGIQGWNITITNATMQKSMLTGADGSYKFTGLVNGTYNVSEEMRTGFTPVGDTFHVETIAGQDITNVNFTNTPVTPIKLGSISGTMFNDSDGNGKRESNEAGLPDWTIVLKDSTGATVATTMTASDGSYKFSNLSAGNYTVGEVLKPGWNQTAPKPVPPGTYTVTITSAGENVTGKDFGNMLVPPLPPSVNGSISGNVINVATGMGVPNVTIRLVGIVGMGVNTKTIRMETMTDPMGRWMFDNLPAGRYIIIEQLPKGFIPVNPPVMNIMLEKGQNSINNNFKVNPISALTP